MFLFVAPSAKSVVLVGDFTQWQHHPIPMRMNRDGVWFTFVPLPRGAHRYRFIVDGTWHDDPECQTRVANPFGGEDMLRQAA